MQESSQHDQVRDRNLVSSEPYEIRYVIEKLASEFPRHDHADLRRIVEQAKRAIQPSENRDQLMEEARRHLRER